MATHQDQVSFGRAGLTVSALGVGCAPLGGLFSSVSDQDVDELIARALDIGVTYFDTAPFYGHGSSERRIGKGLAKVPRSAFRLSTKVGRVLEPGQSTEPNEYVDLDPFIPVFDYTPSGIRRSFESSLERLGIDSIDILYIHDPDDYLDQAINEAYPELDKMRREGLISSIGVGTNLAEIGTRFVRETDIDVALVAGRFTVLDQIALDEFLPEAHRRDVSVLGAGVFNSGVLVNPVEGATYNYAPASQEILERTRAIHDAIAPYGVPVEAVGLQFPLRHPATKAVLTGVRTAAELDTNVKAFDTEVPEQLWTDLEDKGLIRPLGL
ncbi:oxidoreductase [Pontimonas salivibrio]|uniref:Oxidoreductase n=1 Tax=Pontimonas salivibrio TaxID=1159327 RepID=A0A2L2BRQ0_9MICO|nr:aldo/keto reductase [Pontimonas salivibrio]AVG24307.1 oxidoreductase [Pontimonas salivibrio]